MIPQSTLLGDEGDHPSVAARMSWASRRTTTRPEDIAYSLMGIFGVNMPILCGEGGEEAFVRLQKEILQFSDDESIFAWTCSWSSKSSEGLLARSISYSKRSSHIHPCTCIRRQFPTAITKFGLYLSTHLAYFEHATVFRSDIIGYGTPNDPLPDAGEWLAVLNCTSGGKGPVLICLRKSEDLVGNQYLRTSPDLMWVWKEDWNVSSPVEHFDIYVRQKKLADINQSRKEDGLVKSHVFVSASLRHKFKLIEKFPKYGWDPSDTPRQDKKAKFLLELIDQNCMYLFCRPQQDNIVREGTLHRTGSRDTTGLSLDGGFLFQEENGDTFALLFEALLSEHQLELKAKVITQVKHRSLKELCDSVARKETSLVPCGVFSHRHFHEHKLPVPSILKNGQDCVTVISEGPSNIIMIIDISDLRDGIV